MKTCKWCGIELSNPTEECCSICWEIYMNMRLKDTGTNLKILLAIVEERKAWLPQDEN